MNRPLARSILASYLVGFPIGGFMILLAFVLPGILGAPIFTIALIGTYGYSTLGLSIAFLAALGIGGKLAFNNLKANGSVLGTSFKYAAFVNIIIWIVFALITRFMINDEFFLFVLLPLLACVICTVLTTFSIGLVISYIIKAYANQSLQEENSQYMQ